MAFGILLVLMIFGLIAVEKKYSFIGKKKKENYVVLFLIILSFVIFFSDCIFGNWKLSFSNMIYSMPPFNSSNVLTKGPLLSDPIDGSIPSFYSLVYMRKFFQFWNSSNGFGYDCFFTEWLDIKKLAYIISIDFGQNFVFILKYVIAYLGMYLFLKKIRVSSIAAFIGGITFSFSSAMIAWGGWQHTDVMSYAPLLFLFVETIFDTYIKEEKFNVSCFLWFGLILFFMLTTGMPTYVPFYIYLGVIYSVFRMVNLFSWKKDNKFIIAFFISMAVICIVTAMSSFMYTGNTLVSTSDYQENRKGYAFAALELEYIRTLIAPYFRDGFTIHFNESTLFTGYIILFAMPIVILKRKLENRELFKQTVFWGIATIIVLIFIFSQKSGYIYKFIPLINTSLKIRIIAVFNFTGAILSALTVEMLAEAKNECSKNKYAVYLYFVPVIVFILLKKYIGEELVRNAVIILFLMAFVINIVFICKRHKKIYLTVLSLIVALNTSVFAKNYMPLIDKNADTIPKPTESIQYLIDNTEHGERVAAIDDWNFFPNTNVFFGLSDIRSHSFANTKSDIKNYLCGIDDTIYDTNTRTSLKKIDNYNLLKYASVKYVLKPNATNYLDKLSGLIDLHETVRKPLQYSGNSEIKQKFYADEKFNSVYILMSTYSQELSANDSLFVKVFDEAGNVIGEKEFKLNELEDNKFQNIELNKLYSEGTYEIHLSSDKTYEKAMAFWSTEKPIYEGNLTVNQETMEGSLCFVTYDNINTFSDGEEIEKFEDTSPRVFIADNIVVEKDNDTVLEKMKVKYIPKTVFVSEEYSGDLSEISDYSKSDIISYADNNNTVDIKLDGSKGSILVLNDYYSENWDVYIDDVKSDIIKVNYLFRGVVIPEDGVHDIKFVYHNKMLNLFIKISILGGLIYLGLVLSRKKIQFNIEKFIKRKCDFEK